MRQLLTSQGLIDINKATVIEITGYKDICYLHIRFFSGGSWASEEIRLNLSLGLDSKRNSINFLQSNDKLACFLRGELGLGMAGLDPTFNLTPYEHPDNFIDSHKLYDEFNK